jgi:hypothetical protein
VNASATKKTGQMWPNTLQQVNRDSHRLFFRLAVDSPVLGFVLAQETKAKE